MTALLARATDDRGLGGPALRGIAIVAGLLLALGLLVLHRTAPAEAPTLDGVATRFVTLALRLGQIDEGEIDAFFGPPGLRHPDVARPTLEGMSRDLAALRRDLAAIPAGRDLRKARLAFRMRALAALVETRRHPGQLSFADEARRLYGIGDLSVDLAAMAATRRELDRLLPGPGDLADRIDAFRAHYVVPSDRRAALFARAMAECRRRTLAHWALPRSERLTIEWTDQVPAAWTTYEGGYRTLLRINPAAVAFLGSIVDVACHEGYPGHHVQFTLQEAAARPSGLPVEDKVVLLRAPESVFREGAANDGVDLAFPPADRLAFDRDVLFPLAGLPPEQAAGFERVRALIDRLAPASVPILRAYRDGQLPPALAAAALRTEAGIASPEPLLAFTNTFGAYVLGYTLARERVRSAIASAPDEAGRWAALGRLVVQAGLTPAILADAEREPK